MAGRTSGPDPLSQVTQPAIQLARAKSVSDACRIAADACVALAGAQRALVALSSTQREIAASHMPRRESAQALLDAIGGWLDEAARMRKPRMRYGPDGAAPREQRSCFVAPLMQGKRVCGFLYADVEGRIGRFTRGHELELRELTELAAAALERLQLEADRLSREQALIARQTATAEVLKVIAASPSDLQPVFEVIASSARRLLGGYSCGVYRYADETIHLAALTSLSPDTDKEVRAMFPIPVDRMGQIHRTIS